MITKEQAVVLKADMVRKRDESFAEYNRCIGAIRILSLSDGSVDIVEKISEEEEKPDGETS